MAGDLVTHHQYGVMIGVGGEEGGPPGEGTFDLNSVLLLQEHATIALGSIREGEPMPVVALSMHGRVNRSQDTVGAVYFLPVGDAGLLAGSLLNAARRIGTPDAKDSFREGFRRGSRGLGLDDV